MAERSGLPALRRARAQAGRLQGQDHPARGLWKCYACRKPFTVRMRTVFESSHVPLRIWLQAIYLMCSSAKGISTRQLQRTFGGSMKTAWFLGHRIREAMTALGMDRAGAARRRQSGCRSRRNLCSAERPRTERTTSRPRRSFCR